MTISGVKTPKTKRIEGDKPKTLHGVIQVPLYLIQCVDGRHERQIILAIKVDEDNFYTFPNNFWDNMGKLPDWLKTLVTKQLNPKSATLPVESTEIKSNDVEVFS